MGITSTKLSSMCYIWFQRKQIICTQTYFDLPYPSYKAIVKKKMLIFVKPPKIEVLREISTLCE